jgi:DNA topoisomerase-1
MEDELDAISRGETGHVDYLKRFYFGNAHPGLKLQLTSKASEIDAREVCQVRIGKPEGKENAAAEIYVRVGRYGPFLEQGNRRASLPQKMPPDELTVEAALELLDKAARAEEPLGICPDTHKPVFLRVGRFGPYVQRGTPENDQKPQSASLLRGMQPQEVDLQMALRLLSLPRRLGEHPQSSQAVTAHNGRFGPYVKCGAETRSLPEDISPLDATLEQALELLAQSKTQRKTAKQRDPIKVFDASPVTGQPVRLFEGRYGPYVPDGRTNASLPRGSSLEEITFQHALGLLKARAAKGPAKRTTRKKATRKGRARKKTTATKVVKKKRGTKKQAKKKAAST